MSGVLYNYPKQAVYNRVMPKEKIYTHAKPSAALRKKFIQQVGKIIWACKLSPETINLPASKSVPEIQIFSLILKTPQLDPKVLQCLDKASNFPIFYELSYNNHIQVVAAYKRPNEADSSKWVVGDYFASERIAADTPRTDLPLSLNMNSLYEQMLQELLPLSQRPKENLQACVERIEQARIKQNECNKLQKRINSEKQFNRKIELNRELKKIRKEIEGLTNPLNL